MTYTTSMPKLTQFLVDKFQANAVALGTEDRNVFYGDQDRLPRYPAICVDPGDKARELNGAPRRTAVEVTIYVLVYHGTYTDVQTNLKKSDELIEALEDLIHADPFFKDTSNLSDPDQVISSLVTRTESGYQVKSNSIVRTTRLTVVATVQEQLPSEV